MFDSVSCFTVSLIGDATAMTTFRDRDLGADDGRIGRRGAEANGRVHSGRHTIQGPEIRYTNFC